MRQLKVYGSALALIGAGWASDGRAALFDISFDFNGGSTFQQTAFETAATIWENLLVSYQNASAPSALAIDVTLNNNGADGILGYAGYTNTVSSGYGLNQERYSSAGSVTFNTYYIASYNELSLVSLAMHEIAHVIGFGTLWEYSNQYDLTNAASVSSASCYTGNNAVAAYNAEMGTSVSCIPLETSGGAGTAGSHWDEVDRGSDRSDPITFELMTGWLNLGSDAYVSAFTVAAFQDIGYTTLLASDAYMSMTVEELIELYQTPSSQTGGDTTGVPLPPSAWLLAGGIGGLGLMRKVAARQKA